MKLNFQKCGIEEVEILSKISRNTFVHAFEKGNNPVDFQEYINKAFSYATLEKELNTINSTFYLIYIKAELIAYCKLNENDAQTDLKEKHGIEIERIYIIDSYQRKGIGSQIINLLVDKAIKKQKRYI